MSALADTLFPSSIHNSSSTVKIPLSLWNANGLRTSVVHNVLSHTLDTHVLFVTETWLTSGDFPAKWSRFYFYGTKVPGAFNRDSGGVSAFVSPFCPFYQTLFQFFVAPLVNTLSGLASAPPAISPDIDALNDSLNQYLYESLDGSVGVKSGRPGHWKKFWTQEIEDVARKHDKLYIKWRHSLQQQLRSLVQAAKRRS